MAYEPEQGYDNKEFNKALALVWIYSNKKIAKRMDSVVSIINNPNDRNVTKALQEAIVEMRKDIQLWSSQYLIPSEINHLYTKVVVKKRKA